MGSLSFREKTVWGSLIIVVAAAIHFFGRVFSAIAGGAPLTPRQLAWQCLALIVVIVVAEVAYRVVFGLVSRPEPEDERDALIAAKASRNAYQIVATGLMLLVGHAVLGELFGYKLGMEIEMPVVFMLFALVVAEVTHRVSQLVYYRLGA